MMPHRILYKEEHALRVRAAVIAHLNLSLCIYDMESWDQSRMAVLEIH